MTADDQLRHSLDRLANSLQTAVLTVHLVQRTTRANLVDLETLGQSLATVALALDDVRKTHRGGAV